MPESAAPIFTMGSHPAALPEGRGRHLHELWPLGGCKAVARTNSFGLLPLGHMPCDAPAPQVFS